MEIENKLRKDYEEKAFVLERISIYMKVELEELLYEAQIPYLTTTSRIKEFESFKEKIDRKDYSNPFEQVEDFCGLRIICYYRSDVLKISEIISEEFEILESFNKEDLLKENEFGYRSFHIIAKIPKTRTPHLTNKTWFNYKFEIQIRTILMHAWAEIQHKLAYKSQKHIAQSMRKEFAFLSAKLEESDFQFERLKNESLRIQDEYKSTLAKKGLEKEELNLDSLRAFLEYNFPKRKENLEAVTKLLDQLLEINLNFPQIIDAYEKTREYISNFIEKENLYLTRSGIIRSALYLVNEEFWQNYVKTVDMVKYSKWVQDKNEERKQFKENTSE